MPFFYASKSEACFLCSFSCTYCTKKFFDDEILHKLGFAFLYSMPFFVLLLLFYLLFGVLKHRIGWITDNPSLKKTGLKNSLTLMFEKIIMKEITNEHRNTQQKQQRQTVQNDFWQGRE